MKVLAINNGRDKTAYTFIGGSREKGYFASSDFLTGNIDEEIKELCNRIHPEEIILQLPPTGLDKKTQKAIQEGFGRNVATAFSLNRHPVIKNLMKTRASFGCYRREEAREAFETRFKPRSSQQILQTATDAVYQYCDACV